jgi:hypothetical protein
MVRIAIDAASRLVSDLDDASQRKLVEDYIAQLRRTAPP